MKSIIVPYSDSGDRMKILMESLYCLVAINGDFELCVHEHGPKQTINQDFIDEFNIKYLFTETKEGYFLKSWNMNVAAKRLATGDEFVFCDGDIYYTQEWWESIKDIRGPSQGWGEIRYTTKASTDHYFEHGTFLEEFDWIVPSLGCGGTVLIVPRDLFFDMGGFPEIGRGDDNAITHKLAAWGYQRVCTNYPIYHFHHEIRWPHQDDFHQKDGEFACKSKNQWILERDTIPWGSYE